MDVNIEFLEELLHGTGLVQALVDGTISVNDFHQRYGDFFHYNALDGHEATPAEREELRANDDVCRLHERVQGILDLVYTSDAPDPAFEAVGRILLDEAARRIVDLAREMEVSSLVSTLKVKLGRGP